MKFKWCEDIKGTSFYKDTLYASINDIIDLVKETPIQYISAYDIQYEWILEYNNILFTIYSYEEDEFDPDEKIYWNIGAKNKEESKYITKILKNELNNR